MNPTIMTARVSDQRLMLVNEPFIAAGGVDVIQIRFEFCGLWDGCGKTAVFYRNPEEVYHVPVADDLVTVPWEVLAEEGYFYFGVFGVKSNRRPTEVVKVKVSNGAVLDATAEPQEPTPNIYEQLVAAYGVTEARVNNLIAPKDPVPANGLDTLYIEEQTEYGYINITLTSNGVIGKLHINMEGSLRSQEAFSSAAHRVPLKFVPMEDVEIKSERYELHAAMYVNSDVLTDGAVLVQFHVNNYGTEDSDPNANLASYYPVLYPTLPEVQDARVDLSGTVHGSAGDALRSTDQQIRAGTTEALRQMDVRLDVLEDTTENLVEMMNSHDEDIAALINHDRNMAQDIAEIEEAVKTLNDGGLQLEDDIIERQINNWLDEHPEATTTVPDHSLTIDKMVVGTLGYVTPKMFGAKGDGDTDDTAAIQAAMDFCVNVEGGTPNVYIPAGTYLVNGKYNGWTDPHMGGIRLHSGQRVYMDADCVIQVKTNDGAFYNAFSVYQCENVEIHGGTIIGERQTHTNTAASVQGYGIDIIASENVLVDNVDISEMRGDAIVINGIYTTIDGKTLCQSAYSNRITIQNCNLHHCDRQGISVLAGNNVTMDNNSIHDIAVSAPRGGIDIEPLDDCDDVHDILIHNCKFVDCVQSLCFSKCYDVAIDNCLFTTGVVAVHDAHDVKFSNCKIMGQLDVCENCDVHFYKCDLANVAHNAPKSQPEACVSHFYDCRFSGGMIGGGYATMIVAGAGALYFKNCDFMLRVETANDRFVYGQAPCRFDGCTFGSVDGALVALFSDNGNLEFNRCHLDINGKGTYPNMLLNPARLVMQNCYVKNNGLSFTYSVVKDSDGEEIPMSNAQLLACGNVFDTPDFILHIAKKAMPEHNLALLNNTRINSTTNFVRNWSDGAVTVTDINNNKI